MKKKRTLEILLIVLAALIIVYLILLHRAKQTENDADTSIAITSVEDAKAFTYNFGNGEISLTKADDGWIVADDKEFPLDQTYPEDMCETVQNLRADRKLTDTDDLADYGLENPVYTLSITGDDGNTTTVSVGNSTGNDYYVTLDNKTIYTVSADTFSDFLNPLSNMAKLDSTPSISSGNLVKEVITHGDSSTTLESEDEINAIAGGWGVLSLDTVADYSAADADLPDLGLDQNSRTTVSVTYTTDSDTDADDDEDTDTDDAASSKEDDESEKNEHLYTIYIGNDAGDGTSYVMVQDSRIVYKVTNEVLSNILNSD